MLNSEIEKTLQALGKQLVAYLDETSLRMWAAVEAFSLGTWRDYECSSCRSCCPVPQFMLVLLN